MELLKLKELLSRISGCTFAALDADFSPAPGFRKVITGDVVLLYRTKGVSGYENMVKRRLVDIGRDPSNFVLSDLPWGERVDDLPLIENGGQFYLQTILVKPGKTEAFIGTDLTGWKPVDPSAYPNVFKKDREAERAAYSQGLSLDKAVIVRTFKLESLTELRLMHEKITR